MVTSISKNLAQQIVDAVYDLCRMPINFIRTDGRIYASSNPDRIGTFHEIGRKAAVTGETISVTGTQEFQGTQPGINIPVFHHHRVLAVVGITGDPEKAGKYAHLAGKIAHILIMEQEINESRHTAEEKKSYLLQTYMSGEADNYEYMTACQKEFGLSDAENYRMICIEFLPENTVSSGTLQEVRRLFTSLEQEVYAFFYPNRFIGVLKASTFPEKEFLLKRFASRFPAVLQIAVGRESSLLHITDSWQSVLTGLAAVRNTEENYCCFDSLTLEILLSDITGHSRREFTHKILGTLSAEETGFLKVYYENNMSLKATAAHLFCHVNTVQQKLNRIHEKSGMNPRSFRDAVLFYLSLKLTSETNRKDF